MSTQRPIRMCVGCRERAPAADLLRVVVVPDPSGAPTSASVVPDPRQRLAGRGAWVHPDLRCAELAQRRRAYARALRTPGPVDPTPVSEYLSGTDGSMMDTSTTTSAIPQES